VDVRRSFNIWFRMTRNHFPFLALCKCVCTLGLGATISLFGPLQVHVHTGFARMCNWVWAHHTLGLDMCTLGLRAAKGTFDCSTTRSESQRIIILTLPACSHAKKKMRLVDTRSVQTDTGKKTGRCCHGTDTHASIDRISRLLSATIHINLPLLNILLFVFCSTMSVAPTAVRGSYLTFRLRRETQALRLCEILRRG
jgi:hypothetical protein